ncbi:flavin reductase [Acuticoccus kandeliae]|uniref:flavin reductase n=1 Tax=Acuticoccus kandeliae TaxID=2073160 RepID=UPI000D3E3E15|nr:flavin reductase [Acuticoccus kandeliae]
MNDSVPPEILIDTREMRRALGQFATGVTIVTCLGPDGVPNGMTANSFASVSLDPPLVLWSLDRRARSFAAFSEADRFAFSVLAQDQVELSNRFARPGADKFGEVAWEPGLGGVPLLPDPAAHFECRRHTVFDGGDHLIIVGRVERFVRYERRGLVFAEGRYGAIAPHPGTGGVPVEEVSDARHPYDDFLVPLLFRAYNHLFKAFAETLVAEDSDGGQMRILSILSSHGPVDEGELLTKTMLSETRFDEACQALIAQAYVRPAGGDALAITATGEAKLADLLRHAARRERDSTSGLDATEVEMLRVLLRKLVLHHEADQ